MKRIFVLAVLAISVVSILAHGALQARRLPMAMRAATIPTVLNSRQARWCSAAASMPETQPTVSVGQTLPPGCVAQTVALPLLAGGTASVKVKCATAVADGTYPTVFNNDGPDGSFGITSPIFLDNLKTNGEQLGTLAVPS